MKALDGTSVGKIVGVVNRVGRTVGVQVGAGDKTGAGVPCKGFPTRVGSSVGSIVGHVDGTSDGYLVGIAVGNHVAT